MTDAQDILDKLDDLHDQLDEIKAQTRQMRQINRLLHPEEYEIALNTVADKHDRVKVTCPSCDRINLADFDAVAVECWYCGNTTTKAAPGG